MTHPQSQTGAMAQLDGMERHGNTSKTPAIPSFEQVLRGGETTRFSPHNSPMFGREHDMEDDHTPQHKKSVLAKVKEKARKWRHSLSKKKHSEDGNGTPSWGVSLDDDEEEDPEYLGAPMYESEMAPEGYKEAARQHPREVPVMSEKHVSTNSVNCGTEQESPGSNKPITGTVTRKREKDISPKTLTETVTEKLMPACATETDATHAVASKIKSLAVSTTEAPASAAPNLEQKASTAPHSVAKASAARNTAALAQAARATVAPKQAASASMTPKQATLAPSILDQDAPAQAPPQVSTATGDNASAANHVWDKGVSVREYIMQKLEPGEDEKALSQVISQAMSPRKTPGDAGMVEKMKGAVTSFLWHEESSQPMVHHSAKKSSPIPISTNAHEVVEEESHGRMLQAN